MAPKQMIEHTPMKLLANSISWGLKYMLEQGGAQSWVPRNDDPRPGLVFSCSGHQNPRSLLVDEVTGVVSGVVSSLTRKHGSNLIKKKNYIYNVIKICDFTTDPLISTSNLIVNILLVTL